MGDQEEDFSSLPLQDRFVHKNWKVRKEAYEAAAKEFDSAPTEDHPTVRLFLQESSLWKGAVADSNVAAQQEGMGALCSFLQISGLQGCQRTRSLTITPIVEKGLAAMRPAAKQKALECLLLYIELDRPDPIIEELLPILSHKQPKIITATLSALTAIYHAYGCKTVEPKPVLKMLPKVFGHADKNVRAEAQNLTVEFYRWLKDAMKPLFWNDLKPVQQNDLEKLFEKVREDPPPKQERLLRSQQEAEQTMAASGGGDDGGAEDEEVEIDLEPEYEAVNVFSKIPKDFQERLSSSKWKDRKEALDDLQAAINHPKIEEGPFDDIVRALAKCMKDANVAVVTIAANCVELLGKGLRKGFGKYRSTIMSPMMERLKEKKATVLEAIGAALDAVFQSTSLPECLEEILEFLKHKNPSVKLESTKFLIRCLKTTRDAPKTEEVKSIADGATKLLTESQEVQRAAGAEVLGTLWKIMGDRLMNPHLEGLDEIRKTKIKEFYETAEVKAKYKPKSAAPPPKAASAAGQRKPMPGRRPAPPGSVKKPAPTAAPPPEEAPPTPLAPRLTGRPGASKLAAPKSGLAAPGGLKMPGAGRTLGGIKPPSGMASPKRTVVSPPPEEPVQATTPAAPKFGLGRGLAGRPLGRAPPAPAMDATPAPAPGITQLTSAERAELDELRAETERLRKHNDELRSERAKLVSEMNELRNHNAELIENHTRDMLSIKAKETQLVRARSDHEAAEATVQQQAREVERLKRELSRQVRATSPPPLDVSDQLYESQANLNGSARYDSGWAGGRPTRFMSGSSLNSMSTGSHSGADGKENNPSMESSLARQKLSPTRQMAYPGSPGTRSLRSPDLGLEGSGFGGLGRAPSTGSNSGYGSAASGAESWKRAAEVTQNLKARIEMMKAKQQGLARQT